MPTQEQQQQVQQQQQKEEVKALSVISTPKDVVAVRSMEKKNLQHLNEK